MSSQQHRPGVKVSPSASSHAKEQLKRAEKFEHELKGGASEDEAPKLRTRLCEILSDIILTDPLFSVKHDCIGRLWRSCFYDGIATMRQRISREKRKKLPSLARTEKSFHQFLSEAMDLYDYLISQYHLKLVKQAPSYSLTPDSQDSYQSYSQSMDSQAPISKDPAGLVAGLFRMYVHMGDLHRYHANYGKAQTNYTKASKLAPGHGHAYNQLAVVALLKDTAAPLNTVGLYWYARSLLPTHEPFEVSKANLSRLFQSNRDWVKKQTPPPDEIMKPTPENADRPIPKAQRTVASRYFLAQFVDLHYSFFQGVVGHSTSLAGGVPTASNGNSKISPVKDEEIVQQMESLLGPFTVLLKASAFGDALLCKMVAICAFSEFYNPGPPKSTTSLAAPGAKSLLARIFTLALGACLAERVIAGFAKINEQQEKPGSSGKVQPSVRLLLPLLLLCEFIERDSVTENDSRDLVQALSPTARAFREKTLDRFWQGVAAVMNHLTSLHNSNDMGDFMGENSIKSLKEIVTLVGYAPFKSFIEMPETDTEGYLTVDDAVDALDLNRLSQSEESLTQQSNTQESLSGSTQSIEEYRVKVGRFLAFGGRMADDHGVNSEIGQRFERKANGRYRWKDRKPDVDAMDTTDNPMKDIENLQNNDTQPESQGGTKKGDDVLVYSVPQGGGPPLLVPGMLLQNRALTDVTGQQERAASPPPAMMAGSKTSQVSNVGATQRSNPPAGLLPMDVDPKPSQPLVPPKPAQPVMPPPGFGMGQQLPAPIGPQTTSQVGQATQQHQFSVPPGNPVMAMNPHPPIGGGAGHQPAVGMGFGQNYSHIGQPNYVSVHEPTVGQTLHLFGGPQAIRTDNPFAADSTPDIVPNSGGVLVGLGAGTSASTVGYLSQVGGSSFLGAGVPSSTETSVLGSGWLNSLFEDSAAQEPKNPFAT